MISLSVPAIRLKYLKVEDALIKHPAVKECAVIASPDADRYYVVKAYVVLVEIM